jgi:hypothetical protein
LGTRVLALIIFYAGLCKFGRRWPEAETVLLSAQPSDEGDSAGDIAYQLVHYAVNNIKGRWPDAEPMIVRGGSWFAWYCQKLNINPTEVVNNVIDRAKKEKVNIEKTYPRIIMPVE